MDSLFAFTLPRRSFQTYDRGRAGLVVWLVDNLQFSGRRGHTLHWTFTFVEDNDDELCT